MAGYEVTTKGVNRSGIIDLSLVVQAIPPHARPFRSRTQRITQAFLLTYQGRHRDNQSRSHRMIPAVLDDISAT
jgi:hypothetical protein